METWLRSQTLCESDHVGERFEMHTREPAFVYLFIKHEVVVFNNLAGMSDYSFRIFISYKSVKKIRKAKVFQRI